MHNFKNLPLHFIKVILIFYLEIQLISCKIKATHQFQLLDSSSKSKNYCSSKDDGKYPDPNSCQSYILCQNGKERKLSCPPYTQFSVADEGCIKSKQDADCARIRRKRSKGGFMHEVLSVIPHEDMPLIDEHPKKFRKGKKKKKETSKKHKHKKTTPKPIVSSEEERETTTTVRSKKRPKNKTSTTKATTTTKLTTTTALPTTKSTTTTTTTSTKTDPVTKSTTIAKLTTEKKTTSLPTTTLTTTTKLTSTTAIPTKSTTTASTTAPPATPSTMSDQINSGSTTTLPATLSTMSDQTNARSRTVQVTLEPEIDNQKEVAGLERSTEIPQVDSQNLSKADVSTGSDGVVWDNNEKVYTASSWKVPLESTTATASVQADHSNSSKELSTTQKTSQPLNQNNEFHISSSTLAPQKVGFETTMQKTDKDSDPKGDIMTKSSEADLQTTQSYKVSLTTQNQPIVRNKPDESEPENLSVRLPTPEPKLQTTATNSYEASVSSLKASTENVSGDNHEPESHKGLLQQSTNSPESLPTAKAETIDKRSSEFPPTPLHATHNEASSSHPLNLQTPISTTNKDIEKTKVVTENANMAIVTGQAQIDSQTSKNDNSTPESTGNPVTEKNDKLNNAETKGTAETQIESTASASSDAGLVVPNPTVPVSTQNSYETTKSSAENKVSSSPQSIQGTEDRAIRAITSVSDLVITTEKARISTKLPEDAKPSQATTGNQQIITRKETTIAHTNTNLPNLSTTAATIAAPKTGAA